MELALDEASLVPSNTFLPSVRIQQLAETLKAVDSLGTLRLLRSVQDAPDRDISGGRGLRKWCFDYATQKDAGRFVAARLGKAPFLDGPDGLFAAAEGDRAVEATIGGTSSLGGGYVALTDGLLVLLCHEGWPPSRPVCVRLELLTEGKHWSELVEVAAVDSKADVLSQSELLTQRIADSLGNGRAVLGRLHDVFPRLVLGSRAEEQLEALTGSEPFFGQVIRHLRALNGAATVWSPGTPFNPDGVTFSVESEATLNHGNFGPMRSFPTPAGFPTERWTLHTKLTGGSGARLYFKVHDVMVQTDSGERVKEFRVAVGYIGPHLPTVRFK